MRRLAALLRPRASAPQSPAELEAVRILRARRLGRDEFEAAVHDLAFRCDLAGMGGGTGGHEHRDAALHALRQLDQLAAHEAVAVLRQREALKAGDAGR